MSKDEPPIDRLYIERAKDVPISHIISRATSSRQKGTPVGYAQASLVALRRHGAIYTDATKQQPLVRWHARWPFMAANQFTVTDTAGSVVGMIGKTVSKTFRSASLNIVTPDGVDAVGKDAGSLPGVVKMFTGHQMQLSFRFQLPGGADVLLVERGWHAKDPYIVVCPSFGDGRRMDWRAAAAVALIMDVTLNRSSF